MKSGRNRQKRFAPRFACAAVAVLIATLGGARGQNVTAQRAAGQPSGSGSKDAPKNYPVGETFNVRDFGAKGDGMTDDTAAIRRAMEAILVRKRARLDRQIWLAGHHTLYFPDGVYLVSGPLTFGDKAAVASGRPAMSGTLQREIHVVGQSQGKTILRLKDGVFADVAKPQTAFSFFDGQGANNCFANSLEDMTIDTGHNLGAIGLNFHNNNYGYVRRVTLRGDGYCGLNLGSTLAGIGMIADAEVRGFDYGVINGGGLKIGYVLDNITLSGQKKGGIWNRDKALSIRRLTSDNTVPALIQRSAYGDGNENNGLVVLVDSTLKGGAATAPAIENQSGWLVMRGLSVSGYKQILREQGKEVSLKPGDEYVTGGALSLWDDVPKRTLNLPVEDTPAVPQDAPEQIALVDGDKQGDDTQAIQAAIDSGKTTVRFKRGKLTLSDTLVLRGKVRLLDGDWSLVDFSALKNENKPIFRVVNGDAPAVMIEKMDMKAGGGARGGKEWFVQQDTARALVLRDLSFDGPTIYRNSVPGKLFVEGVFSTGTANPNLMVKRAGWEFTHQQVWARHINHEGSFPHFVNDGGKLWILGFKGGEGHGPYFVTKNGGQTEVLGGVFNNLVNVKNYPAAAAAVEIEDGTVAIAGLETANAGGAMGPHPVMVRETRGGQTRVLSPSDVPRRQSKQLNACTLPLYVSQAAKK